jgi:hypothetical protein
MGKMKTNWRAGNIARSRLSGAKAPRGLKSAPQQGTFSVSAAGMKEVHGRSSV